MSSRPFHDIDRAGTKDKRDSLHRYFLEAPVRPVVDPVMPDGHRWPVYYLGGMDNANNMLTMLYLPDGVPAPAMLNTYHAFRNSTWSMPVFEERVVRIRRRPWILDSGAFSIFNSGQREVDVGEFTDVVLHLIERPELGMGEVIALDDIAGDVEKTYRNTKYMWERGVKAMPTYHFGEPLSALERLAAEFPKIALGGAVNLPPSVKFRWARWCFSKVWPKAVHGLGFSGRKLLLAVPWHSVDAVSWAASSRFGRMQALKNLHVPAHLFKTDRFKRPDPETGTPLTAEVRKSMELEAEMRSAWGSEVDQLEAPVYV